MCDPRGTYFLDLAAQTEALDALIEFLSKSSISDPETPLTDLLQLATLSETIYSFWVSTSYISDPRASGADVLDVVTLYETIDFLVEFLSMSSISEPRAPAQDIPVNSRIIFQCLIPELREQIFQIQRPGEKSSIYEPVVPGSDFLDLETIVFIE